MPDSLKFSVVVLLLSLYAGSVWGSDEQPDHVPPRWTSWFSAQRAQINPQPARVPVYQASLARTSYLPPVALANVRDLSPDTNRPRTQSLTSTTWLNGALMTETEMANSQKGSSIPKDTQDDPASRMSRIGLNASSGLIRAGREVWVEWKNGVTTIRSAPGQQWNNPGGDSVRSRLDQNYGQIGLSWNQSSWPSLAVTYSQKTLNHTLETALGYGGLTWDVRLASSYIVGADLLRNGSDNRVNLQTINASLRPLNTLTIAPTLGYRTEQQDWSGVRIDSPSAALAINYQQSQRLFLSAMGNYSGKRSSDRLIDLETIGGKGTVTMEFQEVRGWITRMSMEGGYNQQTNRVMSSGETHDISGLLRLVLTPL